VGVAVQHRKLARQVGVIIEHPPKMKVVLSTSTMLVMLKDASTAI
jgi:hypothetical protein